MTERPDGNYSLTIKISDIWTGKVLTETYTSTILTHEQAIKFKAELDALRYRFLTESPDKISQAFFPRSDKPAAPTPDGGTG